MGSFLLDVDLVCTLESPNTVFPLLWVHIGSMSMNKGQEDILDFLQGPPWHAGLTLQTNHLWSISESIHLPCILLALLHFGKI